MVHSCQPTCDTSDCYRPARDDDDRSPSRVGQHPTYTCTSHHDRRSHRPLDQTSGLGARQHGKSQFPARPAVAEQPHQSRPSATPDRRNGRAIRTQPVALWPLAPPPGSLRPRARFTAGHQTSTPHNHSAACADLGSGLTACISSIIPLHFSTPQPFWLPADMQSPVTLPLDAAHT